MGKCDRTSHKAFGLILYSSLDELDDDLLSELNQVVHDNQLAYLPFARSGRAEALLFDKYPELAERIERGKRAKIDAIILSNKFSEGDGLVSTSFRAQSLEELSTSPLRHRTRRRASRDIESPAATHALKGKGSVSDLMFEMSEGEGDYEPDAKIRPQRFAGSPVAQHSISSPIGSPEEKWSDVRRRSGPSPYSLETVKTTTLATRDPLPPKPVIERTPGRPWGTAPLTGTKLDLKDIMAQASDDKPSNLTLSLSQQEKDRKVSGSFQTKLSQKERKRLQAQNPGQPVTIEKPQPAPPTMSPWQAMSHRKTSGDTAATPSTPPRGSRAPSTPQLTMRQTIANRSVPPKQKEQEQSPQSSRGATTSHSSQNRPTPSSERGMSASTAPIPTPHSIRHIPLPSQSPTSPSQHLSLTEILSIQQAEKDYIRDAAAKRSLQEIQQEQEFQEWWDQESKRVMQEEEQRKRAEERAARGGKSRGKGRGGKPKGKGKDKKEGDDSTDRGKGTRDVTRAPSTQEVTASSCQPQQDGGDRGRGRGKGHRGGRGGARGIRSQGQTRDGPHPASKQGGTAQL